MNKKSLLFPVLISILLFAGTCYGQATFQRIIMADSGSVATSVQPTNDGGYIIGGYILNAGSGNYNASLIKTDAEGNMQWSNTFGDGDDAYGYSVLQTLDGGYILAGTIERFGPSEVVYVVKTDANGDTLWTSTYDEIEGEVGYFIQPTDDGGFIIAGTTNSFGAGVNDMYLLKINAEGNVIWTKSYGGVGNEIGNYVKQTADKGYIVCGTTTSFGAGLANVYLIKTDALGDTLWTKAYGDSSYDDGLAVQQTTDSGYIIAGTTTSFGAGASDIYLIKTNSKGDTMWAKTYGGSASEEATDIEQTTDGGYIVTGVTTSFGEGKGDVYLIKTDGGGNAQWTRTFGGSAFDEGNAVRQTADGGYIIAGVSGSFDNVSAIGSMYIIKTDANGNSGCNEDSSFAIVGSPVTQISTTATLVSSGGTASAVGTIVGIAGDDSTLCLSVGIHEVNSSSGISLYPNPAENQLTVYGLQFTRHASIAIYNILGEAVSRQYAIINNQYSINVSSLPAGLYFIRIAGEQNTWAGKFVKE